MKTEEVLARKPKQTFRRYWRVSDQFGATTIIQADSYVVNERGDLSFHYDESGVWGPMHTTNKHFWRAVTECDQEGKPLWSREIPETAINIEADISSADIEALDSYIKSTTESAIRKAMED